MILCHCVYEEKGRNLQRTRTQSLTQSRFRQSQRLDLFQYDMKETIQNPTLSWTSVDFHKTSPPMPKAIGWIGLEQASQHAAPQPQARCGLRLTPLTRLRRCRPMGWASLILAFIQHTSTCLKCGILLSLIRLSYCSCTCKQHQ